MDERLPLLERFRFSDSGRERGDDTSESLSTICRLKRDVMSVMLLSEEELLFCMRREFGICDYIFTRYSNDTNQFSV